jgi:hypothetical protein
MIIFDILNAKELMQKLKSQRPIGEGNQELEKRSVQEESI